MHAWERTERFFVRAEGVTGGEKISRYYCRCVYSLALASVKS